MRPLFYLSNRSFLICKRTNFALSIMRDAMRKEFPIQGFAGRFIVFEGGEGCGKSTQSALLAERLRQHRYEVVLTREPGGSSVAERIRELVLAEKPQSQMAEFLLFAAARAEHLEATVRPALERGACVICDRFVDSTRVYQGVMGGIPRGVIGAVEQVVVGSWLPDLTLVLDIPVAAAMARAQERGRMNRFDAQPAGGHESVRAAYLDIESEARLVQAAGRYALINADDSLDRVTAAVWGACVSRLGIETVAGANAP